MKHFITFLIVVGGIVSMLGAIDKQNPNVKHYFAELIHK